MDFSSMTDYRYFLNLGSVTVIASVVTLLVTALTKLVLIRRRVISKETNASRRDEMLINIGRWTAVISYASLYIGSQFYLHQKLVFDGSFLVGVLSGGALTLSVSKAIYTAIHQMGKKQSVYQRLNELEKAQAEIALAPSSTATKTETLAAPVVAYEDKSGIAPVQMKKPVVVEKFVTTPVVKEKWTISSKR